MKRLLLLLLLLPLVMGLTRLRFDVEVLNLLPADLPIVHGLRLHQSHFSTARELIITLEGSDAIAVKEAASSLAMRLRETENLAESVTWQLPWIEHPAKTAELAAFLWLNQPPEVFGEMTNRLANPQAVLNETRERLATSFSPEEIARLSRDPFGLTSLPESTEVFDRLGQNRSLFSSEDGTFRVVIVKPRSELHGYREVANWLVAIRSEVNDWQNKNRISNGIQLQYTGGPAFIGEIATTMERDIMASVLGTSVIVAILFFAAYRQLRALLWLLCLLGLTLIVTLALAGLLFGTINVISLGFAAILIGLSADYAIVLFEETYQTGWRSLDVVRRHAGRGVIGAAITTAAAFCTLTFAGMPGLKQLGVLVALGLPCGAVIMLKLYLPPLLKSRGREDDISPNHCGESGPSPAQTCLQGVDMVGWLTTAFTLVALAALFTLGLPRVDHSSEPLRPQNSEAYDAMEHLGRKLHRIREPLWLLVTGKDENEVAERLSRSGQGLKAALLQKTVKSYALPEAIWPRSWRQSENRTTATWLVQKRDALDHAALEAGFNSNALEWTAEMFDFWEAASRSNGVMWPSNTVSRWIFEHFTARTPEGFVVAGILDTSASSPEALSNLKRSMHCEGVWLTGWSMLGEALLMHVQDRLWMAMIPMFGVLLFILWLTLGNVGEMLLCLIVPCAGVVGLLAVMSVAGWSWNLMNLTALPLLLGAGVDYGIHMQLSLGRHAGDVHLARRKTGRALIVCAATTMAGFGSLAWSSNAGLASLGKVCATGIGVTLLAGVGALPLWWGALFSGMASSRRRNALEVGHVPASQRLELGSIHLHRSIRNPWFLYRGRLWRLGLEVARVLPRRLFEFVAVGAGRLYWMSCPSRREIVLRNLLPLFDGDRHRSEQACARLFVHFACKLGDLWRFEAGARVQDFFDTWTGWEGFTGALARGKGVILVTTHIGNWELGAPLLIERGANILVLSNPEPDDHLTAMRIEARARWGIKTMIIGSDPFAFVEVIKHLQEGAIVALLVDRPAEMSSVTVELFGRPFRASPAAADLARATGCAVIPVYIVRRGTYYQSHIMPELAYDREVLGSREARRQFTAEILRAFEPVIRQHADQWYHFIPIWPEAQGKHANHEWTPTDTNGRRS